MITVLANRYQRVARSGSVKVQSYNNHWPCLLPQHGPGQKHTRRILLEPWQRDLVTEHAGDLLRGLFHSDGCRTTNRVASHGRPHEYPRYLFSNKSKDIMGICQSALDRLSVRYTMCRPDSLSVARSEAVEVLDSWIGPKY